MALVGRVEQRPSKDWGDHTVLVTRCLLCGHHDEHLRLLRRVLAVCDCYAPNHLQPVRMIDDD